MTWHTLISWDLPVNPEYDLLRDNCRLLNGFLARIIDSNNACARLFLVFREPDFFIAGHSLVSYNHESKTYTVESAADGAILAYGAEGFYLLKKRVLQEYEIAQVFSKENNLPPLSGIVSAALENLSAEVIFSKK